METIDEIKEKDICFKRNKLVEAILLNIIYMIGMLCFFEPFLSMDDIGISNYLYGAYQDAYDYHTLYSSFTYGRIVLFFLHLMPGLPWYTILTYLWIYISLTLITYVILCWNDSSFGKVIVNTILLFFSYEGYVCIQFTKVSAIVAVAGLFLISQKKENKILNVIGVLLLFVAAIIRRDSATMAIGGWIVMLGINVLVKCISEKKWNKEEIIKFVIRTMIICLIYVIPTIIPRYSSKEDENAWNQFYEWSEARVVFQDYEIPNFYENKELYDSLKISENDLNVWYAWNFDPTGITVENGEAILKLQPKGKGLIEKVFNIDTILSFAKGIIRHLYRIDCFFAFIILSIIVAIGIYGEKKYTILKIMIAGFIALLLEYYLYINGRYDIHRVDIGIMMLASMMLVYLVMESPLSIRFEIKKYAGIYMALLLVVPFQQYSDDLPPLSVNNSINKVFYDNTMKDTFHYYVIGNARSNPGSLRYIPSAFDCIPVGLYKNVFGVTPPSPIILGNLEEYGIDNPYTDLVDNERMYLVLDKYDNMKDKFEIYIEEHSDTEVELILIKEFCSKRIYRVVSRELKELINISEVQIEDVQVFSDVSVNKENRILQLQGNVYVENVDVFSQNVYVQITDSKTAKSKLYYTMQTCDERYAEDEELFFSKITATIKLPKNYDKKDKIYLVIENNGKYYRTEINN